MVKLPAIARDSLVDVAVQRIRMLVEQGGFAAGSRLPGEQDLASQLGVSRTVLREAISRLETIGVLTVQRGRGTFVGDRSSLHNCAKLVRSAMAISPKETSKFAEFRSALECHAARRAAERATPQDVDELQELCDRIDAPGLDDLEAMRRDFRFHLRLVEISGNELMASVLQVLQEFVLVGMMQTTPSPRDREESRQRHAAIVRAIRERDPAAAEDAMRDHMQTTLGLLEKLSTVAQSQAVAGH